MVNEIPEFRIGTDYAEVERYVNNNANLDASTKKSIFEFIKDDREIGDGKISNAGELQMLNNLLNGTKAMPPRVVEGTHEKDIAMDRTYKENEDGSEDCTTINLTLKGTPGRVMTYYNKNEDDVKINDWYESKYFGPDTLSYRKYEKRYNTPEGKVIETYFDGDGDGSFEGYNKTTSKMNPNTNRHDFVEERYNKIDGKWKKEEEE